MPSYEEPVDTAKDLIRRDLIPFFQPGQDIWIQFFSASSDPIYQEISRRSIISEDWDDYEDMVRKTLSTGMYANMATIPWWFNSTDEFKDWYRSTETLGGDYQYEVHLTNKKWTLKKVL